MAVRIARKIGGLRVPHGTGTRRAIALASLPTSKGFYRPTAMRPTTVSSSRRWRIRHALLQQQALPLLEKIRDHVLTMNSNALPQSAAGKACGYTLTLWKRRTCFLDHPELELSNNLAENSMLPVATGRKNWIYIGSQQAGPRVAAILSVIESYRRMKVPVRSRSSLFQSKDEPEG